MVGPMFDKPAPVGLRTVFPWLSGNLSQSEFTTLMLAVFLRRIEKMTPVSLLKTFKTNRFVKPAEIYPVETLKLEQEYYCISQLHFFHPIDLSPVMPLGMCSVMAKVQVTRDR